jgi:hypothetical protein
VLAVLDPLRAATLPGCMKNDQTAPSGPNGSEKGAGPLWATTTLLRLEEGVEVTTSSRRHAEQPRTTRRAHQAGTWAASGLRSTVGTDGHRDPGPYEPDCGRPPDKPGTVLEVGAPKREEGQQQGTEGHPVAFHRDLRGLRDEHRGRGARVVRLGTQEGPLHGKGERGV